MWYAYPMQLSLDARTTLVSLAPLRRENLEYQVEGPAQECTVRGDQVTRIRFPLSGNAVRITRHIH